MQPLTTAIYKLFVFGGLATPIHPLLSAHPSSPGMGLQAFVEAFFQLAGRRSKAALLRDQVASLLEVCEAHLDGPLSALPVAAAVSLEDRRSLSRGRAMAREASKLSPSSSSSSSTTHPPPLCSPAAPRRAVSHDQRLQRSRHGPLRTNLEN